VHGSRCTGPDARRRRDALAYRVIVLADEFREAAARDQMWARERATFDVERDRRDEALEMSSPRSFCQ